MIVFLRRRLRFRLVANIKVRNSCQILVRRLLGSFLAKLTFLRCGTSPLGLLRSIYGGVVGRSVGSKHKMRFPEIDSVFFAALEVIKVDFKRNIILFGHRVVANLLVISNFELLHSLPELPILLFLGLLFWIIIFHAVSHLLVVEYFAVRSHISRIGWSEPEVSWFKIFHAPL